MENAEGYLHRPLLASVMNSDDEGGRHSLPEAGNLHKNPCSILASISLAVCNKGNMFLVNMSVTSQHDSR
jgi:hypothetical protein